MGQLLAPTVVGLEVTESVLPNTYPLLLNLRLTPRTGTRSGRCCDDDYYYYYYYYYYCYCYYYYYYYYYYHYSCYSYYPAATTTTTTHHLARHS